MKIREKQIALLYAIAIGELGLDESDLKLIIKAWGYESVEDIKLGDFNSILAAVKNSAFYLTIADRKELQEWWRSKSIFDSTAIAIISSLGYQTTRQIPRSQIDLIHIALVDRQGALCRMSANSALTILKKYNIKIHKEKTLRKYY